MKNMIRAIVVAIILLAIFHVLAFGIPFVKTEVFWVSYGFAIAAFAVVAASMYIAFLKKPDAKSRLYGLPIARVGVIYGIVQLIASVLGMALADLIPWLIPGAIYFVGLCVALLGLIAVEATADEVHKLDVQLKKSVSVMRTLQSKVAQMAAQSDETVIKSLAEELRYSDPVSSAATAEMEADLAATVDELQAAFVDEDPSAITQLCRKAQAILAERNRLCKLNKN